MKKFRKKPVVIKAEQWLDTVEQNERLLSKGIIMQIPSKDGSCLVPTLEGNMTCRLNDYIVKDENGQHTVWSAETFEAAYDLVEEEVVDNIEVVASVVGEVIPEPTVAVEVVAPAVAKKAKAAK